MTTLYLIRHAHADWTPDDGRPLSERGRVGAQALDESLANHGNLLTLILNGLDPACGFEFS
jgi:phosphohistidine phosphatase SixA